MIYVYICMCACVCMCVYIYIYIYSHPQTDCFVLSELFSVVRHAGRSKPESKPVQLYDRLRLQTTRPQADYVGNGIFRYFIFSKQQQQPLFTFFHTLPATRELNSFEELCIYIYMYNKFLATLKEYMYIYMCVCVCVCVCTINFWLI